MSQPAGLDVRWPLGLLFAMLGALLIGHGLLYGDGGTPDQETHIHINVWWGAVLLIFGVTVLWLARRGQRKGS